jgi:hypothetical protein
LAVFISTTTCRTCSPRRRASRTASRIRAWRPAARSISAELQASSSGGAAGAAAASSALMLLLPLRVAAPLEPSPSAAASSKLEPPAAAGGEPEREPDAVVATLSTMLPIDAMRLPPRLPRPPPP